MKYDWKHFVIAAFLTIALCSGILLYNRWDVQRFEKSLGEAGPHAVQNGEAIEKSAKQTSPRITTLPKVTKELETSKKQETEHEVNDKESEGTQDASFEDFLGFLDELDDEEFAALLASLDLTDAEKEAFADILQKQSGNTPKVHPSLMIIEMIESGVATLSQLIELMESSVNNMSESAQVKFQPVLEELRTLHANGGKVAIYRPPDNPSSWYLMYLDVARPLLQPDMIRRKLESAGIFRSEDIDKIIDKVRGNETEFFLELNDGNTTTLNDGNTTIIE